MGTDFIVFSLFERAKTIFQELFILVFLYA